MSHFISFSSNNFALKEVHMKTAYILVQNLKCGGCANTITEKLSVLNSVNNVKVDVQTAEVSFQYTDELILESVKETLKLAGYPEVGEDNSLGTKAKSFVSCAMGRF
ncbi:hypothetical protein GCM10011508_17320 [Flavobacterium lutivivi]|nr:hypothetical protein GCM10011508_17320 [Flavobacterium lutivivi]